MNNKELKIYFDEKFEDLKETIKPIGECVFGNEENGVKGLKGRISFIETVLTITLWIFIIGIPTFFVYMTFFHPAGVKAAITNEQTIQK